MAASAGRKTAPVVGDGSDTGRLEPPMGVASFWMLSVLLPRVSVCASVVDALLDEPPLLLSCSRCCCCFCRLVTCEFRESVTTPCGFALTVAMLLQLDELLLLVLSRRDACCPAAAADAPCTGRHTAAVLPLDSSALLPTSRLPPKQPALLSSSEDDESGIAASVARTSGELRPAIDEDEDAPAVPPVVVADEAAEDAAAAPLVAAATAVAAMKMLAPVASESGVVFCDDPLLVERVELRLDGALPPSPWLLPRLWPLPVDGGGVAVAASPPGRRPADAPSVAPSRRRGGGIP